MTKWCDPLPPIGVTFFLQIVNVIQPDPPPTYLDNVMIYSDFFFEGVPYYSLVIRHYYIALHLGVQTGHLIGGL